MYVQMVNSLLYRSRSDHNLKYYQTIFGCAYRMKIILKILKPAQHALRLGVVISKCSSS